MPSGWVGVNCTKGAMQARKGNSMTDEERSGTEPTGEESPYLSPEEVAGKAGEHEFPTLGRGGDMTGDQESLTRRPAQDEEEVDGNTEDGGTAPGASTHGA